MRVVKIYIHLYISICAYAGGHTNQVDPESH